MTGPRFALGTAVGARRRRGTGRSRVGGWASTTPRRRRGARAQTGRGHPGAWGGRRDSGFWLARRSPARASAASWPPGRQVRKRYSIFSASLLPGCSPRCEVGPSAVSSDAEGSHRFAVPPGRLCFDRPARATAGWSGGESAPAASWRGDVRSLARGPESSALGTGRSRAPRVWSQGLSAITGGR
jgi:hypothetical protein